MNTTMIIAAVRAQNTDDPAAFKHAFHRGLRATADEAELEIARHVRADNGAAVAGLIEGLAAVRADAGWPLHSTDPYWRRHPGFKRGGAK